MPREWHTGFLSQPEPSTVAGHTHRALIILNQPFSRPLLQRLWENTSLHCCADGGANRLHDVLYDLSPDGEDQRKLKRGPSPSASRFVPDFIKGDLDSLRDDVKDYYASLGVSIIHDPDEYSTDLMKCKKQLEEHEALESRGAYDIILLGGLSGRLDQTVHTLSYMHKMRKGPHSLFTVTDDNVAWVLDEGEHNIHINHTTVGPTCGLLPVGVSSTILTTSGLRWNLDAVESSFDGLLSTSNHLLPSEEVVYIKTTHPICWTAELRPF